MGYPPPAPKSVVSGVGPPRRWQPCPDHPCWRAHQRLHCSLSLSFIHSERSLPRQRGSATTPANCGNELSNLLAPFHKICTPMHTSRNAVSFRITLVPVGPSLLASRSA